MSVALVSVTPVGLPRQTVTPQQGGGGRVVHVILDNTLNPMQGMHNLFIDGILFFFPYRFSNRFIIFLYFI